MNKKLGNITNIDALNGKYYDDDYDINIEVLNGSVLIEDGNSILYSFELPYEGETVKDINGNELYLDKNFEYFNITINNNTYKINIPNLEIMKEQLKNLLSYKMFEYRNEAEVRRKREMVDINHKYGVIVSYNGNVYQNGKYVGDLSIIGTSIKVSNVEGEIKYFDSSSFLKRYEEALKWILEIE